MNVIKDNMPLNHGGPSSGRFHMGQLVLSGGGPAPTGIKETSNQKKMRGPEVFPPDIWALEKQMFLNQAVVSLQGGQEPDILYPVLNRWQKDIAEAYRRGGLSVAANDTLSAFMEAHAYESSNQIIDRHMVMDNLHHAVWTQSEFSEDLTVEYGYDPFKEDMTAELMDTVNLSDSKSQLQQLYRGILNWLNSDALPNGYEVEMLTTISHEIEFLLRNASPLGSSRYIYSAVYRNKRLFAFSRFRKDGRDFIQDCRGTAPGLFTEGPLSSGELLSIWYLMVPATRMFSANGRLIIDNALNSDRAGLLNMLFFHPISRELTFQPVSDPAHIQQFYLLGMQSRVARLVDTALPNLNEFLGVCRFSQKAGERLKALESKAERLKKWLKRAERVNPESRIGVHLTLLEEEWRLLAKEVFAKLHVDKNEYNYRLGAARDLFGRSLYNRWEFTSPFKTLA